MQKKAPSTQEIKEAIKKLDPESYRMQLVQSARLFKSNWVDLGEFLTKVANEKLYEPWGYKSFEDYCRLEIKIKKVTAIKLTNAFFFVSQEGKDFFQGHDNEGLPDLDAVCVLQRAKEENSISPEKYQALKEAALEQGQSGQTLGRKYKQMITPEEADTAEKQAQQGLGLVNRLRKKLQSMNPTPNEFSNYLSEIEQFLQSQATSIESTPTTDE